MENLVVIKSDVPIDGDVLGALVEATKSYVVILPMRCTITSGEDALAELQKYKEVIERFLPDEKSPSTSEMERR